MQGVTVETWFETTDPDRGTISAQGQLASSVIAGDITPQQLLMLAKNEPQNDHGRVDFDKYYEEIDRDLVVWIKLLAKLCVTVTKVPTLAWGGFSPDFSKPRVKYDEPYDIYYASLSGYQFQHTFASRNSGALFLIGEQQEYPAEIVEWFYQNVVGEAKRADSHACAADQTDRYQKVTIQDKSYYLDKLAYEKAVAFDFITYNIALNKHAEKHDDKNIVSRFLSYGSGAFAADIDIPYSSVPKIIAPLVTKGAVRGHDALKTQPELTKHIGRHELPFHDQSVPLPTTGDITFTMQDALAGADQALISTTNGGDPHAPDRNEGMLDINAADYSASVDASIGTNIGGAGETHPNTNPEMQTYVLNEAVTLHQALQQLHAETDVHAAAAPEPTPVVAPAPVDHPTNPGAAGGPGVFAAAPTTAKGADGPPAPVTADPHSNDHEKSPLITPTTTPSKGWWSCC
ncbi:MAG: hypothetical protein KAT71_05620 [Gammaproteobacteria bacterium]|nr:hypothetical protein [Gammaproteobacteria bacterium]